MKNLTFIRKLWRLLSPFHRDFYIIFTLWIFIELGLLSGPFIFGKILDLLIVSKGILSFETALFVVGGLAGVRLFTLIVDYIGDILIVRLLWGSEKHISTTTYNKLLELSIDYHEKVATGAKINLVNKGKDKLIDLLAAYTWEFQPIVLKLIITSILILLTSWLFGIVFVASIIPFLIITYQTYKATKGYRQKRHDLYELSSSEIGDTISNITVVKAFAQEQREEKSFQSIWNLVRSISAVEYKTHMISSFSKSLMIEVFYILLIIIGIFQIRLGILTVGSLVFLISLVERAYSNIYRLGRIYERAVDAAEPVERITALMQENPSIKNIENPISVTLKGEITFNNVSFVYPSKTDKTREVLHNLSFNIPAGSFTALVGKSGSGKSTIAKLLSRYYDPVSGRILIDKKFDLKKLDLDSYRAQTAVVFQDSPVPNRKIWEVIAYSAGLVSFQSVKHKVIEASKLAHAHEFISELKEGYQTQIGERGVKLSGGQKQRLAIARALFNQPKILIMDEPTSHLDTISEAMIQRALEDISKQRSLTKIIIAHRLSTVQKADQILVMEKGHLVEKGAHSQLLKKAGVYANIVKQSELRP